MSDKIKYLKATDLASACGVDLKSIHNWVDSGQGPKCFRTPGRHLRFTVGDAVEWLRKGGWTVPAEWVGGEKGERL